MKLLLTITASVALLLAGAAEATPRATPSVQPPGPHVVARTGPCTASNDWQLMSGRLSHIEARPGTLGLVGFALPTKGDVSCEATSQADLVDDAGVPEALGPPSASPLPAGPASSDIEAYAAYDPQRICAPSPLPGTLALRSLLVSTYPGTRSGGISRDCTLGGTSEHKEGRALDWAVSVHDPDERRAAEDFLGRLLATDAAGNPHALARRMGVMYVIWNGEIWSASRAGEGWRPYHGPSAHTDHVHLTLSWAGGLGLTSYWRGSPELLRAVTPDLSQLGGGVIVPTSRPSRAQPAGPVVVSSGPLRPTPVAANPPPPPPRQAPVTQPLTASPPPVRSGASTPTPPTPAVAPGPAVAPPGREAPSPSGRPAPTPAPSPPVVPVTPGTSPAQTCLDGVGIAPANAQPPSSAGAPPATSAGPSGATAGSAQPPAANPPAPAPPAPPGVPATSSPPPCP